MPARERFSLVLVIVGVVAALVGAFAYDWRTGLITLGTLGIVISFMLGAA